MANNNNSLRDIALNTSLVIEGIVKSRKTTKQEKALLLIERLSNAITDLTKLSQVENDSQK